MMCKTKSERCVLKDDLANVLAAAGEADVLVLASPVYFGDVSAQMKAFIDRTYSYLKPDYATAIDRSRLKSGRKLLFILTQGHPDESFFSDIFARYKLFFQWYGFDNVKLVRACGMSGDNAVASREDVIKAVTNVAAEFCEKV